MYEDLRKIRTERGIRLKECADVIGVQEACYCNCLLYTSDAADD